MKTVPKKDALTELIHSLSKNESGYFVKYAKKQNLDEKNHYVWLFQRVKSEHHPNWKKIEKQVPKGGFTTSFVNAKRILYDHIMRCLVLYKEDSKVGIKIRLLINFSEILISKGLLTQAKKIIEKGKKIALEHEEYHLLLNIRFFERWLITDAIPEPNVEQFYKEQQFYLKMVKSDEYVFYHVIHFKFMLRKYLTYKSEKIKQRLSECMKDLRKLPFQELSFLSKQSIISAEARYEAFLNNNFQRSNQFLEQALQLYKEQEPLIQRDPYTFLNLYLTYTQNALILRKYDKSTYWIDYVNTIPLKGMAHSYREVLIYFSRFFLCLKKNKSSRLDELISEFSFWRAQNQTEAVQKIIPYITVAIALHYYRQKRFEECIRELDKLIESKRIKSLSQLTKVIYFLFCVVYDKLNSASLLESSMNKFEYYLREKKDTLGYDAILLKASKTFSPSLKNEKKRMELFKAYQKLKEAKLEITFELFDLDKIIGEQF